MQVLDGRTANREEVGLLMATGGREAGREAVLRRGRLMSAVARIRAVALAARHLHRPRAAGGRGGDDRFESAGEGILGPDAPGRPPTWRWQPAASARSTASLPTLASATPLVLAGLAVGVGFKAGLFNIGAQGQFLMGAVSASTAAIMLNGASPAVAIPARFWLECSAGCVYGFIPGFLKAFTGAHEVVTTIMLNYVAIQLVSWIIGGPLRGENVTFARTDTIVAATLPVIIGRDWTSRACSSP